MSHKKHKAQKSPHKPVKNFEKPPPLPSGSETREFVLEKSGEAATTQELALNMYAREATAAIDSFRILFPLIPSSFFDIAQTNAVEFVRLQMRMLELMTNQSKAYVREIDETAERAA